MDGLMMNINGLLQIAIYIFILLICIKPLGIYIASVYECKAGILDKVIGPIERLTYRLCAISPKQEMGWKTYAFSMLIFNALGIILLYILQRAQLYLPFNPQQFSGVAPDLAFNTAVSFTTNTDWQAYSGENSLSYFTQMAGLTVQNFLSAATGLSIMVAFTRGLNRQQTNSIGNFWVDAVRGILYILLPLSILLAIFLVSQGVLQNFKHYEVITLSDPVKYSETKTLLQQSIPMGPVASQVAIKQLGTNGGGFFNANSAHPFENPTPLTNFVEMLAIMLIPMALCYTFGVMVKDTRQGWAIFWAMFIIFIPLMFATVLSEKIDNPIIEKNFREQVQTGVGNMEGKETRFGITNSGLWAAATTATSNGSTNSTLDSFMPLGGLIPLWLIDLGESIFGGVGSGLSQMLMFVIVTVFISGLMVGRTPEYLGKKLESYEIKMTSFVLLIMPTIVLLFTAIALMVDAGKLAIANPGTHGFTEVLYAFSSLTNNNGSAFGGLNSNTYFYNTMGGVAILIGRYWIAISLLAIAGSLASKKSVPESAGTLPTHSFLFILILVGITLIFGALTFFPALCVGPIVEHLMLQG